MIKMYKIHLCRWNAPRKRKESNLPVSQASFMKHIYRHQQKHQLKPLEDFDPHPVELRGKAKDDLAKLLGKVRGQDLDVSLLQNASVGQAV